MNVKQDSDNKVDYKLSQSGRITILSPDKKKERKLPSLKQRKNNDASCETEKTVPMSPELSPRADNDDENVVSPKPPKSPSKKKKSKIASSPKKSPKRSTKRTKSGSKSPKKSPTGDKKGKDGLSTFIKTSSPKTKSHKGEEEKSMWETIADDEEFALMAEDLRMAAGDDDEDDDINSVGDNNDDIPNFNDNNSDLDKSLSLGTGEASMGLEDIFCGSDDDYDEKDIEEDIMETTTPPPSPPRAPRTLERESSLRMDDIFALPEEGAGGKGDDDDKKKRGVGRTKSSSSKNKNSVSKSSKKGDADADEPIPNPPLFIEFDSSDTNLDLMQHQKQQQDADGKALLSPVRELDIEDSPIKSPQKASRGVRRSKSGSSSKGISRPPLGDDEGVTASPSRRKSRTTGSDGDAAKRSRSKSRRKSRTVGGDHHNTSSSSMGKSSGKASRRKSTGETSPIKDSASRRKARTTGGDTAGEGKSRRKSRTTGGDLVESGRRKSLTTGGGDDAALKSPVKESNRRKSLTTGGGDKSPAKDSQSRRKSRTAGGDTGALGASPSWGAVVITVSEEKRAAEEFDKAASAAQTSPKVAPTEGRNWPDNGTVVTGPQQAAGTTTSEHDNAQPVESNENNKASSSVSTSSSKKTRPGMGAKILSMASLKAASVGASTVSSVTEGPPPKILILISSRNSNRAVKFHQRWAFTILDSLNIEYYIMDADDSSNDDVVKQLCAVSSMPEAFPQIFTSRHSQDQENPDFTFKGNWGWLDVAHEHGNLPSALFS